VRLLVNATRSPDGGIWQAYMDEVPVGKPIDLYNDKVDNFEFHCWTSGPSRASTPSRWNASARTPSPKGSPSVWKRSSSRAPPRVTEYGYDKDKDWRKNPTVFEDD